MNWYLSIRALCVVAYVAALACLLGAIFAADEHNSRRARFWALAGFAFAIVGCLLVGFGWTPEHP